MKGDYADVATDKMLVDAMTTRMAGRLISRSFSVSMNQAVKRTACFEYLVSASGVCHRQAASTAAQDGPRIACDDFNGMA